MTRPPAPLVVARSNPAAPLITLGCWSDTECVRRATVDVEPGLLVQQLAELLETATPARLKAEHIRVDRAAVASLVRAINRATGTVVRRDWRGRVTVSSISPLAAAANETSEAIDKAHRVPLTDDVIIGYDHAARLAASLRRALA